MGGTSTNLWDSRSIVIQRKLVIDFFAKLMNSEFPVLSELEWAIYAEDQFKNGSIIKSFANILLAHNVSNKTIQSTLTDPLNALCIGYNPVDIVAYSSGTLIGIDQRKLGEIINRNLNAARNDVEGKYDPTVGAVIMNRLGDKIKEGTVLCKLFADSFAVETLSGKIRDCFVIG